MKRKMQVIAYNDIPFSVTFPTLVPALDEKSTAEFNRVMETGLKQAKNNESYNVMKYLLNWGEMAEDYIIKLRLEYELKEG